MRRRNLLTTLAAVGVLAAGTLATSQSAWSQADHHGHGQRAVLGPYHHLVVIYQENHGFDNLYGTWGKVGRDHVDGLAGASAQHVVQVAQDGTPYRCLLQNDVNLTAPTPLPTTCEDPAHGVPASHFRNRPFTIDQYIGADDRTCPPPGVFAPNGVLKDSPGALPGGCTRDLVHRFYQEQYQLAGGRQNRYTTGSDAAGLTASSFRSSTTRSTRTSVTG